MKLLLETYIAYEKERAEILAPVEGHKKELNDAEDEQRRGYVLSKALIIEAWSKCRPKGAGNMKRINVKELTKDMKEVKKVLGKEFLQKFVDGVKIRYYFEKQKSNKEKKEKQDNNVKNLETIENEEEAFLEAIDFIP